MFYRLQPYRQLALTLLGCGLIACYSVVFSAASQAGQSAVATEENAQVASDRQAAEAELAAQLLPLIEKHRGEVAVAIKHLPSGVSFTYEADRPQSTASLIKLPVLMTLYQAVQDGKVDLSTKVELTSEDKVPGSGILTDYFSPELSLSIYDAAHLMIAFSDNTGTNLVIDQIGLPATSAYMKTLGYPQTRLFSKVYRGDTAIDQQGRKEFGLGSTTPNEMLAILEQLHAKKFIDETTSDAILKHMFACRDESQFRRQLPRGVRVAHKTGAVTQVRTDAGIVPLKEGVILYCVMTQKNEDRRWTPENAGEVLAADIGKLVYNHFTSGDQAASESSTSTAQRPRLAIGSGGDVVRDLQHTLNTKLPANQRVEVDGDFGPMTHEGVIRFQKQQKLEPTGVVDATVWKALEPIVSAPKEPKPAPRARRNRTDGAPEVSAKAWSIIDLKSGRRIANDEGETSREPASVTKIMTAHLVLKLAEKSPEILDEEITFSERADKTIGSTAGVNAGEKVKALDLLYGLMLPSGNDASVALAEHFGDRVSPIRSKGGYDGFIEAMNREARRLKMRRSAYRNPHGLPNREHVTTTNDMAVLAREAMGNETFRKIVNSRQHSANLVKPDGEIRKVTWYNTNRLLREPGYFGVKTGTTGAAGACLVSCAENSEGQQLLMVVLGSENSNARYEDSLNLYKWVWEHPRLKR